MKKHEKKDNPVIKTALDQKVKLICGVLFNIAGTVGMIAIYYYIYLLIAHIFSKHAVVSELDFDRIQFLCIGMGVCVVIAIGLTALSSYLSHNMAFNMGHELKKAIVDKMSKVELGYFSSKSSGEIKAAVSEDCAEIEDFFADHLGDVISGVVTPVGLLIMMFSIDVKMSFAAIISIPFALVASLMLYANKKYTGANKQYNEAMGKITADAVEYFKALPVVRIFNSKGRSEEVLKNDIETIYEATKAQGKHSMFGYSFFTTFVTASLLGILPMSVYEYAAGGDFWILLSKIMFFYIVGANLAGPLMNLVVLSISFNKFKIASDNINEILSEKEMPYEETDVRQNGFDISFEHVRFAYDKKDILSDCNLTIEEGKTTAILGASGAGKSTVSRLIAGFWKNYEGQIKIGGKSIKSMTDDELYSQIGFVFQENYIISDTVEANIRMNNKEASMEDVIKAAKNARIHDLIMSLPMGYQTVIGDGGHNLSGGEKQRIGISRLFLKNAPILVLDEATSYADAENEALIQKALKQLSIGKTVIMIAHRMYTIKDADKIIMLKDGKVDAEGDDRYLRENSPLYQKLWDEYMKGSNWVIERCV